jgi:hypothetical protein
MTSASLPCSRSADSSRRASCAAATGSGGGGGVVGGGKVRGLGACRGRPGSGGVSGSLADLAAACGRDSEPGRLRAGSAMC